MKAQQAYPYQIRRLSTLSGRMNVMVINLTPAEFKALLAWNAGDGPPIQEILPGHTAAEREFFISGLSPAEQKEMFELPLRE